MSQPEITVTDGSTTSLPYFYDAFLSYSAGTDYDRARRIETFLESFHKGAGSRSLTVRQLQICRDGSDFTLPKQRQKVNSNLERTTGDPVWEIIEGELKKAKLFDRAVLTGALFVPGMCRRRFNGSCEPRQALDNSSDNGSS
jgi:hypothetical protein